MKSLFPVTYRFGGEHHLAGFILVNQFILIHALDEVDAFSGNVAVFYDGIGKYKRGSKNNPNCEAELKVFEIKQRARLISAGYIVRSVFNREPTDMEILEWNSLADGDRHDR